jgi:hypothetical protein
MLPETPFPLKLASRGALPFQFVSWDAFLNASWPCSNVVSEIFHGYQYWSLALNLMACHIVSPLRCEARHAANVTCFDCPTKGCEIFTHILFWQQFSGTDVVRCAVFYYLCVQTGGQSRSQRCRTPAVWLQAMHLSCPIFRPAGGY